MICTGHQRKQSIKQINNNKLYNTSECAVSVYSLNSLKGSGHCEIENIITKRFSSESC